MLNVEWKPQSNSHSTLNIPRHFLQNLKAVKPRDAGAASYWAAAGSSGRNPRSAARDHVTARSAKYRVVRRAAAAPGWAAQFFASASAG